MFNFLALYYCNAVVKPVGKLNPEIQNIFGYPLKAHWFNYPTLLTRSSIQLDKDFNEW